jgi:hypothetical protein
LSTSSSEPRPPLLRRVARGSLVAVLTGLAVLGALELTLRLCDDFDLNSPAKIRQLRATFGHPEVEVYSGGPWRRHEFTQVIHRNDFGFHAKPFAARPEERDRIAVVGDSFVEAKQVDLDESFVVRADAALPGIQLLAVGKSALYAPLQRRFFEQRFPSLFGEGGELPPVQGVVFCVRQHGARVHVAYGTRRVSITRKPQPWQYRWLERWVNGPTTPVLRQLQWSESRALGLVAARLESFLSANQQRTLAPATPELAAWSAEILRREVFEPNIETARQRGLAVGFLYLPTVDEVALPPDHPAQIWRRAITAELSSLDVPALDAAAFFEPSSPSFFPVDKHPNERGHAALAAALSELVERMTAAEAVVAARPRPAR